MSVPVGDVEPPGVWVVPTWKPWQLAAGGCPGARCLVPGPGPASGPAERPDGEAVLGECPSPGWLCPAHPWPCGARVAGTLGAWLLRGRTTAMAAFPSSRKATLGVGCWPGARADQPRRPGVAGVSTTARRCPRFQPGPRSWCRPCWASGESTWTWSSSSWEVLAGQVDQVADQDRLDAREHRLSVGSWRRPRCVVNVGLRAEPLGRWKPSRLNCDLSVRPQRGRNMQ